MICLYNILAFYGNYGFRAKTEITRPEDGLPASVINYLIICYHNQYDIINGAMNGWRGDLGQRKSLVC